MSYLIYHPQRQKYDSGTTVVYHDNPGGNQDPYIWNKKFLHSFCHITQIKPKIGNINFWVWGENYPDFTELLCDCVFLIEHIWKWEHVNSVQLQDRMVDNEQAFKRHYNWVNPPAKQHVFKKRKSRFTLKADEEKSFQPQNKERLLIDILPFLNENGISTEMLTSSIAKTKSGKKAINSKPFKIDDVLSQKLYDFLAKNAAIKLKGKDLSPIYPF